MRRGLALAAASAAALVGAPAAGAAETHTFQGRCDLVGKLPAAADDPVVQKGTCTGSLDGAAAENHSVKVVSETTGSSIGPLPGLLEGTGQTTFEEAGVTVGFDLHQVGLVLRILGVGGSTGYGVVIPRLDQPDFFDTKILFPQEWRGEAVEPVV